MKIQQCQNLIQTKDREAENLDAQVKIAQNTGADYNVLGRILGEERSAREAELKATLDMKELVGQRDELKRQ